MNRYLGDNKDRIKMEVNNSKIFTTKLREDRNNLFYRIFGY